jgi:hypothetical protein
MALTMADKTGTRQTGPFPPAIAEDLERNRFNPRVGTRLLSENERVRVWEVRLQPGERIGFHRHVLDYFWTSVTGGSARSHDSEGYVVETSYEAGETRHASYGPGEFKLHDLENIGDAEIVFTTVEFLDSANKPLPLTA